ncbi:TPA: biotin carboxylase N-terminal domain-containing protein [Clostridioides difficile]|uniref:acetyl-CoA carboxylase biotin carboxylase subunit n=1 Tax=Clostridioides difficile TaxID=1496 RepID=UPI001FEEA718|nr:biotin carboxylase N-terminal domain-containing protein [Clostridioides difficile]MCI4311686.1 ATP-grasp domain-containing protein [Clostridioides difficile]MDE3524604.1 biotin carboxylase N-terminal domain-containing protein [Clostridioides difficile]
MANRGEIAVRIIKALKEMGFNTIALYSTADENALYTKIADEKICIGPPESKHSYLDTYKILSIAKIKNVNAIHPGIGFLAENGDFAQLCEDNNITFIGPPKNIIEQMGNKNCSKKIAQECDIPVILGGDAPVNSLEECKKVIKDIGYPVMLKASYGGGGKGIRVVKKENDLETNYELCLKEAEAAFSNCEMLVEQYVQNTRHIEVQILADRFGNIIHLGNRECTIQRSNQKLIEEACSANISETLANKLYTDAVKLAQNINYIGPGTVEFLVLPDESYYFLEMNTRLQVEHTITELVSEVDIVKEQINVFFGEKLKVNQNDILIDKYAIECRVLAEDVKGAFMPSFGEITNWSMPGGNGVRVDTGYQCHNIISPYYDSLLAKICCVGKNKKEALAKMSMCLEEAYVEGVNTNINFLRHIILDDRFATGKYDNKFVDTMIKEFIMWQENNL